MDDMFFFDQDRLDSLLDLLEHQCKQLERLHGTLQFWRSAIPPDQIVIYDRIQERLVKSEDSIRAIRQALYWHSEDLVQYDSRLASNLDELVTRIDRVFS